MKKLMIFLKPYRWWILLSMLLLMLRAITEVLLPRLMAEIVDQGIVKNNQTIIYNTGLLMLAVAFSGAILAVFNSLISSKVSTAFSRDLRAAIFSHVERFSLNEFNNFGPATLITRVTNDVTQLQMVTMMLMRIMVMAPMMAIGSLIMAFSQNLKLSLVILGAILVLAVFIALQISYAAPLFKIIQQKIDQINLVLRENLTGVRVIRAFNREERESQRFDHANTEMTDILIRINRIMSVMFPGNMIIMNLGVVGLVWFGARLINISEMRVGTLMSFIQYAGMTMFSVVMVSFLFMMIPRAQASAGRINEILDTKPEISDPLQVAPESGCHGCVDFEDVSFSYPGAEEPVLRGLTFSVSPGEFTAIIGGTGSGKSTLINLIPRNFDVTVGRVLVNGVDVREMTQADLRSKIGYVPQQAILFSGSVSENIRFGKENASEEEVRQAAITAQADEFITAMAEGYDTQIDQGGANLSGGQKQRLAIARALVRKPEIYIFDDSFSALDFKTDARLRAALREEIEEATVLIVAQRVSTVLDADRIIVLDEGQVAGIGKHRELIQTCEVYREIVASQLSEEELA